MTARSIAVKGVDLAKVIRNAQLWQEPDVRFTRGRVLLSFSMSELSLYATDGYAAVRDSVEYTSPLGDVQEDSTWEYWFTEDEMDFFLLMAVDAKTGPLTITFGNRVELPYSVHQTFANLVAHPDKLKEINKSLGEGSVFFGELGTVPDWVEGLEEALEIAENPSEGECQLQTDVALRPERLVKFLRVRADKEAPVDFRFLNPWNKNSGPMAAVKIGHTFRGLVNFVNRRVARENLTAEQKEFLW